MAQKPHAPPEPRAGAGRVSARRLLFALFASLLLIALGATVWLLVDGGRRVVGDVVRLAATASQEAVSREAERFLATGDAANLQLALAFEAPRVTPDSPAQMQRLLRDIERLTEPGTVSNLYVGLPDGRFYGLTADPRDWPTMSWRYTEASPRTDGELVFYTDANGGRVGPELGRSGRFDPRVRPWYVGAHDERASIWTAVYPNFFDDTPTITRALALRDGLGERLGVAGADLFITHVQRFLTTLELSAGSEVFVVDQSGEVIAAWGPVAGGADARVGTPRIPFESLRFTPYALGLIAADGGRPAPPPRTSSVPPPAAPRLVEAADPISGLVTLDGQSGFLSVATLTSERTPPWRVGVFVPSSDYLGSVAEQVVRTVPLGATIALLSLGGIASFAYLVARPLERLGAVAERIATGRFDERVAIPRGREVATLALAIDDMRERLGTSFEALDAERERAAATLDAIADAVLVIDEHGRVTRLNPAAERLLGRRGAECAGEPIERVLEAREARTGLTLSARALRGELAATRRDGMGNVLVRGADDVERSVRLAVSPLGGGLEPRGAVLVLHDGAAAHRGAQAS